MFMGLEWLVGRSEDGMKMGGGHIAEVCVVLVAMEVRMPICDGGANGRQDRGCWSK